MCLCFRDSKNVVFMYVYKHVVIGTRNLLVTQTFKGREPCTKTKRPTTSNHRYYSWRLKFGEIEIRSNWNPRKLFPCVNGTRHLHDNRNPTSNYRPVRENWNSEKLKFTETFSVCLTERDTCMTTETERIITVSCWWKL